MLYSRIVVSMAVTLSLVSAHAELACYDLFNSLNRAQIISQKNTADTQEVKSTILNITHEDFDQNSDKALSQLIFMAASNSDIKMNEKSLFRDNRLKLGIPLGNGYSIEVKYRSDFSEGRKFTLEGAKIKSPSNRSKRLADNLLEFKELDLRTETHFDLSDIYPDGHNINLKIPLVIEGKLLEDFMRLVPKFQFFEKDEIRNLAQNKSISQFKFAAQKRYLTGYFKEYFIKGVFKTWFKLAIGIPLIAFVTYTFKPEMKEITEIFHPAQTEWVQQSILNLESTLPSNSEALKAEISSIENLAIESVKSKEFPHLKNNLDSHKFKISSTQYAWIINGVGETTTQKKTFFVISQDNQAGQIQYFAIEIDPAKYTNIIQLFNKSGQYIEVGQ